MIPYYLIANLCQLRFEIVFMMKKMPIHLQHLLTKIL